MKFQYLPLSCLTENTAYRLQSEVSKLGVGEDPERGGDGGHDQPQHGDLPLGDRGYLHQPAGQPDDKDKEEDGQEPDGEAVELSGSIYD